MEDLTVYVKLYKEDLERFKNDPKGIDNLVTFAVDHFKNQLRGALRSVGIEANV